MKQRILFFVVTFLFFIRITMALTVTGVVYEDKNQNGLKDASEKTLRDIPVSNGVDIVLTDTKGAYKLTVLPGNSVFPILPAGFALSGSKAKVQNAGFFFVSPADSVSESFSVNFALKAIPKATGFRMAAVGDVQFDNEQEIQYTAQTLMPELMERKDLDFCLFMGDMVNDKSELLPVAKDMIAKLPAFLWTVYGNHDRKTKTNMPQNFPYNQDFGASSYAFNHGAVHFLILNNIYTKGKAGYEGGFSESQLAFAANDLKLVSKDRPLVIAMHIPLKYTGNQEDLLRLLKDYDRVLILSAHTHTIGRHFLKSSDKVFPELIVGATCGSWWTGERDEWGNPSGLMQCGSPRNYFVLDFNNETYNLKYKGIGLDPDIQMDIWVNGQDTLDAHVEALAELPSNTVAANVFGGSDSTVVTMQVDDLPPITMEKCYMVSPNVSRISFLNKEKAYPTVYSRRAALRKQPSPHIWKMTLPEHLTPGIHSIKISARDSFGFEASGARVIHISEK